MKDERQHLQLFDLIARDWKVAARVDQIAFNASQTAVAFGCADGSIAIAATADKSSPDSRIRREADTARLSIQPRSVAFAGLKLADHTEGRSSAIGTHGADNFLFAKASGRINTVTPGGTSVHLPAKAGGAIVAVDQSPDGECLAFAEGSTVTLCTLQGEHRLEAAATVTALCHSPMGGWLAIGHQTGVLLFNRTDQIAVPVANLTDGPVRIEWSRDGQQLLCCLGSAGLGLVDLQTRSCTTRGNFPAAVTSAGFGNLQDTIVASGAFRVAAWGLNGTPITTGKSGLVLVDAVATSPNRNLVAVGYANGLLSLTEIGRSDEILLRQDTGAGISALTWSANGRYLGVGGRDGAAALVEFPDSMFKS